MIAMNANAQRKYVVCYNNEVKQDTFVCYYMSCRYNVLHATGVLYPFEAKETTLGGVKYYYNVPFNSREDLEKYYGVVSDRKYKRFINSKIVVDK